MRATLNNQQQELGIFGLSILNESPKLALLVQFMSSYILNFRNYFLKFRFILSFLTERNDLNFSIISEKELLLANSKMFKLLISKHIFHFNHSHLAFFGEFNNIEPASTIFPIIQFKGKVFKEYVPRDYLVLENLLKDTLTLSVINL